jgi:hypothetical protein
MSFLYSSIPPVEALRVSLTASIGPFFAQTLYVLFMYCGILGSATLATLLFRGCEALVRHFPKAIRAAKRVSEPVI